METDHPTSKRTISIQNNPIQKSTSRKGDVLSKYTARKYSTGQSFFFIIKLKWRPLCLSSRKEKQLGLTNVHVVSTEIC